MFETAGCDEGPSRKPLSLPDLFLPDGFARRSFVIGSNCPSILLPSCCNDAADDADLVILAPTPAECRIAGWLQDAVQWMSRRLVADGVAYVVAPPRWRLRIRRLLGEYGLLIEQAILHLPDYPTSRYLIPLDRGPAEYAVSSLLSLSFGKRLLAVAGVHLLSYGTVFNLMLPSAGLVVRRPGARSIFEWLSQLGSGTNGKALISTSSRGKKGSVVIHHFPVQSEGPSVVAKIALQTDGTLVREAAALYRLGPIASSAGARIPLVLGLKRIKGHSVLLQTGLRGQTVGALLASRCHRLPVILNRVVSWLESWNSSTIAAMQTDRELLEREILDPVALLAPLLDQGDEYEKWLKLRCRAIESTTIALVTAHNDLTMWNLVLGEDEQLGVVDWESARENDLPFVDLFYAVVDAIAIARGFDDRSRVLESCFVAGGAHERFIRELLMRLRRFVRAPDDMVELCFHACWLHHAANERRRGDPSDPRPFFKIVQWLVLNRPRVGGWLRA